MSSCDLPVLPAVLMLIACRLACCACWAHSGDVVLSGRLFVCIIRTKVAHYDWKRHNECLSYRSCRRDQVSANGCYTDITESCVASLPLTERKVRGQYMTPAAIGDMMAARLFNGSHANGSMFGTPSVIDPACGTGTFVAGFRRRASPLFVWRGHGCVSIFLSCEPTFSEAN